MYKALGVGYGILLRRKKKENQMYLFDFIPYLKAHLIFFFFVMFCFGRGRLALVFSAPKNQLLLKQRDQAVGY